MIIALWRQVPLKTILHAEYSFSLVLFYYMKVHTYTKYLINYNNVQLLKLHIFLPNILLNYDTDIYKLISPIDMVCALLIIRLIRY